MTSSSGTEIHNGLIERRLKELKLFFYGDYDGRNTTGFSYVIFRTEKGSLDMEVKAPDGTPLYRGNGRESTDLALNIPQSGLYKIAVEGRHAKGSVRVGHSQA